MRWEYASMNRVAAHWRNTFIAFNVALSNGETRAKFTVREVEGCRWGVVSVNAHSLLLFDVLLLLYDFQSFFYYVYSFIFNECTLFPTLIILLRLYENLLGILLQSIIVSLNGDCVIYRMVASIVVLFTYYMSVWSACLISGHLVVLS